MFVRHSEHRDHAGCCISFTSHFPSLQAGAFDRRTFDDILFSSQYLSAPYACGSTFIFRPRKSYSLLVAGLVRPCQQSCVSFFLRHFRSVVKGFPSRVNPNVARESYVTHRRSVGLAYLWATRIWTTYFVRRVRNFISFSGVIAFEFRLSITAHPTRSRAFACASTLYPSIVSFFAS